jgi:glutathione S-transferase
LKCASLNGLSSETRGRLKLRVTPRVANSCASPWLFIGEPRSEELQAPFPDGFMRTIRKTDLIDPFPRLKAYFERCQARAAWQRTLGLYAERLGVSVDDIR